MPKYRVWMHGHASGWVDVEADDKEAAIEEAYQEGIQSPCAQCSGMGFQGSGLDIETSSWEIGDEDEDVIELED